VVKRKLKTGTLAVVGALALAGAVRWALRPGRRRLGAPTGQHWARLPGAQLPSSGHQPAPGHRRRGCLYILAVAVAGLAASGCGTSASSASYPSSPLGSITAQPASASARLPGLGAATHPASGGPAATRSGEAGGCDPALWQHVYHAYRLQVISACKTVAGTVEDVSQEPDGDTHIRLKPDPRYASLINSVNSKYEHGDLVVEAICTGAVSQADAVNACHGFTSGVRSVTAGDRIAVTGSYVLDADHGWTEIHPVTRITVIGYQPVSAPSSAQPSPSAPTHVPPAGCYPKTSSGNCYEPGEFCSKAEHGETGVAGDGKTITCEDVNGYWRWED
jgi:hypothetical protein